MRGSDIIGGIDLLIAEGVADPDRLGFGGASHGGLGDRADRGSPSAITSSTLYGARVRGSTGGFAI